MGLGEANRRPVPFDVGTDLGYAGPIRSPNLRSMSALPPKADIGERDRQERRTVRFTYRLCQPDARFFNLHGTFWRQTIRNLLGIRTVRVKEIAMEARPCTHKTRTDVCFYPKATELSRRSEMMRSARRRHRAGYLRTGWRWPDAERAYLWAVYAPGGGASGASTNSASSTT